MSDSNYTNSMDFSEKKGIGRRKEEGHRSSKGQLGGHTCPQSSEPISSPG